MSADQVLSSSSRLLWIFCPLTSQPKWWGSDLVTHNGNSNVDLQFYCNTHTDFFPPELSWVFENWSYLCACGCGHAEATAWRTPFHRWYTHRVECVSECASSEPPGWCTLWGSVCKGRLAGLLWQEPLSPPPLGDWREPWRQCISSAGEGHMCVQVRGWGGLMCVLRLPLHCCWHCCSGMMGSSGPGGLGWQRVLFGRWVGRGRAGHSGPTPDLLWSRWH